MELTDLRSRIIEAYQGPSDKLEKILELVQADKSIFPFNEYEYLICTLIDSGGFTYEQYIDLRSEYISENPNLWLFEISAPRGFGEKFAQTYVLGKCSKLKKAAKKLDKNYCGDYDLWLDGITIEVKASRAVESDIDAPLYHRALSRNTDKQFLMNFQQLKPQCCQVFIWLAVFRDEIVIWVMSSREIQNHRLFSKGQHRGNSGNEGQLHITKDTIDLLSEFELRDDDLEKAIRRAAKRN